MAARNRPRNGLGKDDGSDAHEERTMWNSIVNDLRKLKTIHARAAEIAKQQVELEEKIASCKCDRFLPAHFLATPISPLRQAVFIALQSLWLRQGVTHKSELRAPACTWNLD